MMQFGDIVNACFELGGGLVNWTNVTALYRDKQVRGINWMSVLVFSLWGYFQLYYYPSLGQWFSLTCSLAITSANTTWLFLVIYYMRKNNV
jgi:hypothetical protein